MKDLFVPYSIAKQLSTKGFNEYCLTVYKKDTSIMTSDDWAFGVNKDYLTKEWMDCLAPTYQQAVDWFREKHNIELSTTSWKKEGTNGGIVWYYSVNDIGKPCKFNCIDHKTIYEAITGAINEAFKLI